MQRHGCYISKCNYLISQLPEDSEFISFLCGRQAESQVINTDGKPTLITAAPYNMPSDHLVINICQPKVILSFI